MLYLAFTFIVLAINFMKQNVWQAFLDTFVFITIFSADLGFQSFLIDLAIAKSEGVELMVVLAGVRFFPSS